MLVVDGINVIGSRPDGWWRDRAAAVHELLEQLQRLAARSGEGVTLVLDGAPIDEVPEGTHHGVRVLYARRTGRDAGDDRVVEVVAAAPEPASVEVATSDRTLATRVSELGAAVIGARSLLARLDRLAR